MSRLTTRASAIATGLVAGIVVAATAAEGQQLLLLDGRHLERVGSRLLLDRVKLPPDDGHREALPDDALKEALAALEKDATEALAQKPLSVMDKGVTPPSGDKHDYMSQAPYWWPDPSKADGRPYIRKDGQRNPEISRISDHDLLRSRHVGRFHAGPGLPFDWKDGLCPPRIHARSNMVPRPGHADEPAFAVRPGDSGDHRGTGHRHHRDASAPAAARRHHTHVDVARVDRGRQ